MPKLTEQIIDTVQDLINWLLLCNPKAKLSAVPEDGDGFWIERLVEIPPRKKGETAEVWILLNDGSPKEDGLREDWEGCGEGCERPGDMAVAAQIEVEEPKEKPDVVKVRGLLKSA